MLTNIKEERDLIAWIPVTLWCLVILVLSVLPYKALPAITIGYFDKMVHFFEYSVLVLLGIKAYKRAGIEFSYRNISLILILSGGYGILIELIQRYVPGRNAELTDIAANFVGIFFGLILGRIILWQK